MADLTERERQVARLVAQGRRTKEVAAELGIGVKTVANLLTDVYRRTGTAGRVEFVAWWQGWHSFAAGGELPPMEWGPRELAPVLAEAVAAEVERRVYRLPAHHCKGGRYVHAAGVIEAMRHLLTGKTRRPGAGGDEGRV